MYVQLSVHYYDFLVNVTLYTTYSNNLQADYHYIRDEDIQNFTSYASNVKNYGW